ncbi:hypothetical protein [Pseudidiomarina woesei]|uniref:Secreted protein n=1 Tax=Pseudidiomarina woesei TaxID=1381080 RepID=A0A0K6H8K6_9GAMM|nr:hypothetical protein [Pseudidiomarina woesei]CUA87224.1 hypothetical protein Ga0061064_1732 [Pseudidiomarina woesei]
MIYSNLKLGRTNTFCAAVVAITGLTACAPANQNNNGQLLAEQSAFMQQFQPYCGQAFNATIVQDNQPSPAWDHPLVVHIRDCEDNVVRMPLHVGDDRSRTWVLTQHPGYIDFQHIHLHEDGSADAVSPYGGQTLASGSATIQAFPVDEASKALFIENGLDVSVANTWTIQFFDAKTMSYKLSRPGRIFEVQVDLSQPIDLPPPAWGYHD